MGTITGLIYSTVLEDSKHSKYQLSVPNFTRDINPHKSKLIQLYFVYLFIGLADYGKSTVFLDEKTRA